MIEVNIAIIVGYMPVFAHLAMSTGIGGSAFFRSLRSRLLGTRGQPVRSKTHSGHSADMFT
ncbi:hypothetical protein GGR56DRAFT_674858 [Xylariaceae sp. FL0804]|nr:hypothetical protein GGR56DRAFT_674858 [Xylariaceae sp. FL0804]